MRVIQREEDFERHIYDGSLSAVVFLEDVRVGDRIDVASTIRGNNPIFEGKFVDSAYLGCSRNRVRLLVPAGRRVQWKSYAGDYAPNVTETAGGRELVWDLHDQPAVGAEDLMPSWVDVYPWVQLSEFATWQELSLAGKMPRCFGHANGLCARAGSVHRHFEISSYLFVRSAPLLFEPPGSFALHSGPSFF